MVDSKTTISIITLNVNGLNTPIKKIIIKQRDFQSGFKKKDPTIYCGQKLYLKYTDW